eukprot:1258380-Prymnesium_polylepis.1
MPAPAVNGAIAAANRRASCVLDKPQTLDATQARQAKQQETRTRREQAERLASRLVRQSGSRKQIRALMRRHGVDAAGCLRKPEQACSLLAEVFDDAPLDDNDLRAVLSSAGIEGYERIQVTMHDLGALFDAYETFTDERARLDILFTEIDGDGSGMIERSELARYLVSLSATTGVPKLEVSDADVHVQLVLDACGCGTQEGVRRAKLPELLEAAKSWAAGLAKADANAAKPKRKRTRLLRSCTIL